MPSGVYTRKPETIEKYRLNGASNGFQKGNKVTLGVKLSKEHKRKIGLASKRLGLKPPLHIGKRHRLWKGSNVGYFSLHAWVRRWLGKATKCEHCGREWDKPRSIHWANKSHQYLRKLSDWIQLCAKCHKIYDSTYSRST